MTRREQLAHRVLAIADALVRTVCRVADASAEPQTCARRYEVGRADERGADRWLTTRWHPVRAWRDRLANRLGTMQGGQRWPAGEPTPRTCSFCGGVHPADAIALLDRGWTVESTSKFYKRYLHPPGYDAAVAQLHAHATARNARIARLVDTDKLSFADAARRVHREETAALALPVSSPVPPVKLYVQHVSESERRAFNDALDRQRARELGITPAEVRAMRDAVEQQRGRTPSA
jgi:hypothetical protein